VRDRLFDALLARPLVLDAAMGTRLIDRGLDLRSEDPALWNLSNPDSIGSIHRADIAAGADAVVTNTFGANRVWLARYGREADVTAINRQAVAIARDAAGPDRFLLGSIGPTAARLPGAYREQAEALAGVDALLLETHTLAETLVGLSEIGTGGPPIIASLFRWDSIDEFPRLIDLGASVVGANCMTLEAGQRLAEVIHATCPVPLLVKPSGMSPAELAGAVPNMLRCGVRMIGGCCGTVDAHVAAIRSALDLAWTPGRLDRPKRDSSR
jgi:5-methyltetrahydrofolate--homocysteine methyltransferase